MNLGKGTKHNFVSGPRSCGPELQQECDALHVPKESSQPLRKGQLTKVTVAGRDAHRLHRGGFLTPKADGIQCRNCAPGEEEMVRYYSCNGGVRLLLEGGQLNV